MELIVCTGTERERFDAAIAASPLADALQSWAWGELKRSSGWAPLRLLVTDGEQVRAACSLLRRRLAPGVPPLLYSPRGPVFEPGDDEALAALIRGVRERAGGAFAWKADPPVEAGGPAHETLRRAGFGGVSSGAFGGVQPAAVMICDLEGGAEAVFSRFKSKWRYNVRLARRKGVTVREGTREDLAAVYDILQESARRDGFALRGRPYFERMWDLLEPAGSLRSWIAEHDGRPVAAILCTTMGERVIYNYGGFVYDSRELMPNHLVHATAMGWAADEGFRIYDFRGVSPVRDGKPVEEHLAGLNRFKEGFGARYVEYAGEMDLPLRRGWHAVWRHGAPVAFRLRAKMRGPAD